MMMATSFIVFPKKHQSTGGTLVPIRSHSGIEGVMYELVSASGPRTYPKGDAPRSAETRPADQRALLIGTVPT